MPKRVPAIYRAAARRPARRPEGGNAPSSSGRIRVASGIYSYAPSDAFRAKRPPTPVELIQSYRYATYVCASINATAVATQPFRLYATTTHGRGKALSSFCRPRSLNRHRERWLESNPTLTKRLAGVDKVEEITDHPILELFDYVNPWLDRFQLLEMTQLYREIDGRDFWYWVDGPGERPIEVWPLPSWMVYVQPDYTGTDVVKNYIFTGGGGQAILECDQLLFGKETSLFDPYIAGFSPLRANYELAQIYDKQLDYRDATISNRGRPDAMLIPKEDQEFNDPVAIQRITAEYEQSYSLGRAGRLWVPPGGTELKPINWSPTDMGEMAQSRSILHDIARAFRVPVPLVDGESANRANMDAALLQHARYAVLPRIRKLEEHWNSNWVTKWDDSGRLFLAFDDPVPADKVLERETNVAYVGAGIRTRNEVRADLGDEAVEDGDELLVSNTLVPLSLALKPPAPVVVQSGQPPKPDEVPPEGRERAEEIEPEPREPEEGAEAEPFAEGEDVESERGSKSRHKFNPRHDQAGRFTSASGASAANQGLPDRASTARGHAVQSEVSGVSRYADVQGPIVHGVKIPPLSHADRSGIESRILKLTAARPEVQSNPKWTGRREDNVFDAAVGTNHYRQSVDDTIRTGQGDLKRLLTEGSGEGAKYARALAYTREIPRTIDRLVNEGRLTRTLIDEGDYAVTRIRHALPASGETKAWEGENGHPFAATPTPGPSTATAFPELMPSWARSSNGSA